MAGGRRDDNNQRRRPPPREAGRCGEPRWAKLVAEARKMKLGRAEKGLVEGCGRTACGEVVVGRGLRRGHRRPWEVGGGGEADLAIDRGRWWPEGGGGRDGGGQRRKKWTGERRGRDGKGRKHEGGAVEL